MHSDFFATLFNISYISSLSPIGFANLIIMRIDSLVKKLTPLLTMSESSGTTKLTFI